jgi:putative membrane protein
VFGDGARGRRRDRRARLLGRQTAVRRRRSGAGGLTGTLSTFVDGVADLAGDGTVGALVEPGTVVVTFGVGAVVGVLSVAHAVKYALRRFREATLTFLVALMVGALYYPAEQVALEVGAWTPTATLGVLGAGAVGAGLVLAVDHVTGDIDIGGDETDERPAPTAK